MTNVGDVIGPRTPSPSPSPWVNVVLPAPRSPTRSTRSPARSRVASSAPIRRIDSASGASTTRPPSARCSSTFGGSRRTSRKPCFSQNAIVSGQLLTRHHRDAGRTHLGRQVHGGPDQDGRDARALSGRHDPEAPEEHRVPDRVEEQRADRGTRRAGPAARRRTSSRALMRLERVGGRVGGRVEHGPRAERLAHDGEHLRGRLGADRGDADEAPGRHGAPTSSAAAEISWSRAALTWSCRSSTTM